MNDDMQNSAAVGVALLSMAILILAWLSELLPFERVEML